jgi:hypothetical protein
VHAVRPAARLIKPASCIKAKDRSRRSSISIDPNRRP